MLNKKGERELAYIVIVDAVEPIEGYDKIAFATVGGWHCVVGADMKAGDRAVYFEIDSLVPADDERFAFCEKYKYRIRTQRYCKGTRISQGLLLPLSDFPEFENCEVGTFVTDKLKVTYYEAEDRQRKGKERENRTYKPFFNKIKRYFPFKQMMRTEWGRNFLFAIFGLKKKKSKWPEFVPKTDEERCLVADTQIETNEGKIRIGAIVNKQLNVYVKSVNTRGEIEYKPIVGYQKIDGKNEEIYQIITPIAPYKNRTCITECSKDHKFYNGTDYIEAQNLKIGSMVMKKIISYPEESAPFVYGILLGDGHLSLDNRKSINGFSQNSVSIEMTQGKEQLEYLQWKAHMFGIDKLYNIKSGYTQKSNIYRAILPVDDYITKILYDDKAIINRKLYLSKDFCKRLTKESIALLYQDDGSITHCNSKADTWWIRIATNRYSYEEVETLRNRIEELFNITVQHTIDKNTYESLAIRSEYVHSFLEQIKQYIHPNLQYKLLAEKRTNNFVLKDYIFTRKEHMVLVPIVDIKKKKYPWKYLYDITVKDNHNFFANGLLTHNCQNCTWVLKDKSPVEVSEKLDGSSSTYAIRKLGRNKYKIWVCSRNVVLERDQKAYYDTNIWYEIYDKYHIEDFLKKYIEDTGAEWAYLQGEIFGPSVQKRDYGFKERHFRTFILCDSNNTERYSYQKTKEILEKYDIPTVPVLDTNYILPDTCDELISFASGASEIDGQPREGLVFRRVNNPKESFKAVDPEFLLKFH